ncbi:MAG: hypothetical protein KAT32_00275 [Candidatus Moranbacteria bacterium]|nr:hypothetical protein [Candidatus Moranbacteria bacterium]
MERDQEHVGRLFVRNPEARSDSETKAKLRNVRLQENIDQEEQGKKVRKLYGNITRPMQTFDSNVSQNFSDDRQKEKMNELRQLQREEELDKREFGIKIPRKAKILLKRSYRRINRHERPIWILNFIIAFSLDFIVDIVSLIPYVGWIVGGFCAFCGSIYLTISLWRVGNRKARTKKRVIRVAMLIADAIPYIGILPISIATVFIAYEDSIKESRKAKVEVKKLQKKYPNLVLE